MIYQIKQIIRSICLPVQILPQQQESDPDLTNTLPWEQEQDYWSRLYDSDEPEDDYNLYGRQQDGSSYDIFDDDDTEDPGYEEDAL